MIILFFLSALLSEVAGTIAGFGSSTIFLPLALFFLDFNTALVLVAFLHIFGNFGRVTLFKHGLDKKIILRFGLPSVIFSIIGALLVSHIPQDLLKGVLGFFLAVYAVFALKNDKLKAIPSVINTFVGGSLSGFIAGLIGTGGAIRGGFLSAFNLPKEKYIATIALIALAVDATRIPVYLYRGFLDKSYYWYLPVLFLIALLGSIIGKKVIKKVDQKTFRKIVLVAILIVGVKFMFDLVTL